VPDQNRPPTGPLVLVVEDEPIIRLSAIEMVEEAGYTAVEAHDAAEAVRILETRPDIRIVFTDIDMPGSMNGILLAAAIRHRWPPIEIILTSGAIVPASALIPDRGVFVPKPYSQGQLESALHQVAAARPQ
jgi:CheY-like chemotaxis protein